MGGGSDDRHASTDSESEQGDETSLQGIMRHLDAF